MQSALAHQNCQRAYGDDLAMIVGFAESAEVDQPFTADAKQIKRRKLRIQKKECRDC